MAKHTPKEILEAHELGARHTHESAVQGTYDMGYARGVEDFKEKAVHKDPELAKEILDKRDAEAAAGDPEAQHEQLEQRKRELADEETPPTQTRAEKRAEARAARDAE